MAAFLPLSPFLHSSTFIARSLPPSPAHSISLQPLTYLCAHTPNPAKATQPSHPSVNFFQNTPLCRRPPTLFPADVDSLLDAISPADRFIPLWHEKTLLFPTTPSRTTTFSPVLWTSNDLRTWLTNIRQTDPSHSPMVPFLAYTPIPLVCYFAVNVSSSPFPPVTHDQQVYPLRSTLSQLDSETEAALVTHAKVLLSWHASAQYCSRCGAATVPRSSGLSRVCRNDQCRTRNIYPRIMPSVLALVLRQEGTQVLLGRKESWPPRRYSVLAGFAEIFESLEETVAREVQEETGVIVDRDSIAYHSSQPWPSVPQASLMSGFRAYVTEDHNTTISIDRNELQDAKWFEKHWLKDNLDDGSGEGAISIPGPTSLARRLILEWLAEPDSTS